MGEPICAIATPHGRSAIAIIRASGNGSLEKISKIFSFSDQKQSLDNLHRKAVYGKIFKYDLPSWIIDDVILIPYKAPFSYTGEDSLEIQCHGNPIIVEAIIKELYKIGFSPARSGEFTRRAFLSGKMNIDQADAVSDIIDARNQTELQYALAKKDGFFRKKMLQFRSEILNFHADLTSELDFMEEDIQFLTKKEKLQTIKNLTQNLQNLIALSEKSDLFRKGITITIMGPPNTGKSSLLNYLSGSDKAIVSSIPGTTRDIIESHIELAGTPVTISDTAGIRHDSQDTIEKMGIKIAMDKASVSDIHYLMLDGSISPQESLNNSSILESCLNHNRHKSWILINKWDIVHSSWKEVYQSSNFWEKIFSQKISLDCILPISVQNGYNIDRLNKLTENYIKQTFTHEEGLLLSVWQKDLLIQSIKELSIIKEALKMDENLEIITASLNIVLGYIAELTGEITSEDILGRIFSRFCIGK